MKRRLLKSLIAALLITVVSGGFTQAVERGEMVSSPASIPILENQTIGKGVHFKKSKIYDFKQNEVKRLKNELETLEERERQENIEKLGKEIEALKKKRREKIVRLKKEIKALEKREQEQINGLLEEQKKNIVALGKENNELKEKLGYMEKSYQSLEKRGKNYIGMLWKEHQGDIAAMEIKHRDDIARLREEQNKKFDALEDKMNMNSLQKNHGRKSVCGKICNVF